MGQILTAGEGQNPARQASIAAGIPGGKPGLGGQPALRVRPARGRARLPGDPQRRFRDRGGGRPGIHEHGAALCPSARWRENGQFRNGRHHDQGRAVGRLQRLSHGQHGRKRRAPMADHARAAGRIRGRLAEQGRGRPEGGRFKDEIVAGDDEDAQGRRRRRCRRISQARHHAGSDRQAATGLRQGRHRHGRQRVRHQ